MENINKRFIEFYDYLKKEKLINSAKNFAESVEISPSLVTEILKGRTNIGVRIIQYSVLVYGMNSDWLLTGNGSMFKTEEKTRGSIGVVPHINQTAGVTPQNTPHDIKAITDLIQTLSEQKADIATQLGMQIKENEQLHKQNMELLAENERLTNKAKKVTSRPADKVDHYPIAAESKPEYK